MQEWIVGAIVVCAFWAVAKRYLPKAVRKGIRARSVRAARRLGLHGWASRLEAEKQAAAASCADGCGSCGGCDLKAALPSARKPVAMPTKPTSDATFRKTSHITPRAAPGTTQR